MNAPLRTRHAGLSRGLVAGRAAVAVGVSALLLTTGAPSMAWQLLALLAAMLTTGLSHGAVDHLVASRFFRAEGLRFYGPYLAVIAGTAGLWLLSAPLALGVFLALSVWHFGEGDLRDQAPELQHRVLVSVTRGLLIIGTLFSAWPDEVVALLGEDLWLMPSIERSVWIPAILWAVHFAMLGVSSRRWSGAVERAALDAAGLALWLWSAPPILAFAGYFAVWHSMAHIDTLRQRLVGRSLLFYALPLTLLAAAGGGLALVLVGHWLGDRPVAAVVLPVLAALATPHVLVVEAWRWRDPEGLASSPVG